MALPATDNFNRADVNPIGGNWTTVTSCYALQILSSVCAPQNLHDHSAGRWNADSFANDQYSQFKWWTHVLDSFCGPSVRISAVAQTFYSMYLESTLMQIRKTVAGVETELGSAISRTNATGSVYKLSVSGTTLTGSADGADVGSRTDSTITSGSAGIWFYEREERVDDWEGGNAAAGGLSIPVRRPYTQAVNRAAVY